MLSLGETGKATEGYFMSSFNCLENNLKIRNSFETTQVKAEALS